ncbi:expressed unknown protein [Seminavis robusta]|uniref:BTB domain-containing protein n=1 Tax=Seminavis robusta TaxID=568900 RepID=A0A9N8EL21_9STRA|nr:expressed unknown protein [Seminavis robusta]|eukprot:Sro1368_g266760.1 n/a (309) ;mRNA; f:7119-8045
MANPPVTNETVATQKRSGSPPLKKTCVRSSLDPDVVIVVGGQEFQEYSQSLRCWSEYFDKALRSRIGRISKLEGEETLYFEFPYRDPKEWQMIVDMMAPMSTKRVNRRNVMRALSWFGELSCPMGLHACDIVISRELLPALVFRGGLNYDLTKKEQTKLNSFLDILEASLDYNLSTARSVCFSMINYILWRKPSVFLKIWMECLIWIVRDHKDCYDDLWKSLGKDFLPPLYSVKQKELLMENNMLADFIWLKMEARASAQKEVTISRMMDHVETASISSSSSVSVQKRFVKDDLVRLYAPSKWRQAEI